MEYIDLLKKVTDKTISTRSKIYDMDYDIWDWQQGVGIYGIYKAWEKTGEKKYFDFIKDWVDFHIEKGLPQFTINTTIPFTTVIELYKQTGKKCYKNYCDNIAKFIITQAKRADEGTLEHTVLDKNFSSQIWADTLFMGALFLAKWGNYTGEDMYCHEAARQLILHYKYLIDSNTGVMFHGYNCSQRNHMSSVRWGRANGWGVISSVEILQLIPQYFGEREIIIDNLNNHIKSLLKYQEEDGMWHTALDHPETYEETTAACCYYYGISKGMRLGYVKDDYSDVNKKAIEAIVRNIASDGQMLNTSTGTPVMQSVEDYNKIPCDMTYYGQGIALLALVEATF